MTLNLLLASIAAALWSVAYGWYFSRDIRGAWRRFGSRRERRRQQNEVARAAWARHLAQVRMPPRASQVRAAQVRQRPGPLFVPALIADDPAPARQPAARPEAKILPFPARGRDPAA